MELTKEQDRQYKELIAYLKALWNKPNNDNSYNLTYVKDKNKKVIFCLYIYHYSINADGKRVYQKPIKTYKRYEKMKEYIIFLTETNTLNNTKNV